MSEVPLWTEMLLADLPLNVTVVAPVRLVPVKVTQVPAAPLVGARLVIVEADTIIKLL